MIAFNENSTRILNILTRKLSKIGKGELFSKKENFSEVYVELSGEMKDGFMFFITSNTGQGSDLDSHPLEAIILLSIDKDKKTYSPINIVINGVEYKASVKRDSSNTIEEVLTFDVKGKEIFENWLLSIEEHLPSKRNASDHTKLICKNCEIGELWFSHNAQIPLTITKDGRLKVSKNLSDYNFFDNCLEIRCSHCEFEIESVSEEILRKNWPHINASEYIT